MTDETRVVHNLNVSRDNTMLASRGNRIPWLVGCIIKNGTVLWCSTVLRNVFPWLSGPSNSRIGPSCHEGSISQPDIDKC